MTKFSQVQYNDAEVFFDNFKKEYRHIHYHFTDNPEILINFLDRPRMSDRSLAFKMDLFADLLLSQGMCEVSL